MDKSLKPEWVFRSEPADGGRDAGDTAEYAFHPSVDVFVREVLQNSKDQHDGSTNPVEVVFSLITLRGKELEQFLDDMKWNDLRPHIEAGANELRAASSSLIAATSYESAIKRLASEDELLLLRIDDYNTEGLTGPESGDTSNFTALVRDKLYSRKPDAAAGGSYGLGKAVLWKFSSLSTVLFNSVVAEKGGQMKTRFIGRIQLPWHKVSSARYAGPGWFGKRESAQKDVRAVSIWGHDADENARRLRIERESNRPGTSIGVLGFYDPAADKESSKEDLGRQIIEAATTYFWPSLMGTQVFLRVTVKSYDGSKQESSEDVAEFARKNNAVTPFIKCQQSYVDGKAGSRLINPGDVAETGIPITIPAKKGVRQGATDAEASLVVRLAEDLVTPDDPYAEHVALFRGSGQVIKYVPLRRLSITARPYHAILVCGKARRTGNVTEKQALEEFLRASEPPMHDDWTSKNARLREQYKQGFKKALDNLEHTMRQKLKEMISEGPPEGGEGPQLLRNLFRVTSEHPKKSPFRIRDLSAKLNQAGDWEFRGKIVKRTKTQKAWETVVDVRFANEDGSRGEGGMICEAEADTGVCGISDGRAIIRAPSGTKQVSFKGRTDHTRHPVDTGLGTVELFVNGKVISRMSGV